jgi:hypothetical protein
MQSQRERYDLLRDTSRVQRQEEARQLKAAWDASGTIPVGDLPCGISWAMSHIFDAIDPAGSGFAKRLDLMISAGHWEAQYQELGPLVELLRAMTEVSPPPEVINRRHFLDIACQWYVTGERWEEVCGAHVHKSTLN